MISSFQITHVRNVWFCSFKCGLSLRQTADEFVSNLLRLHPLHLQRHFMLCVLLEAGGCASKAIGHPGPDCIYVDQVKATILQLEGIDASIEERLDSPSIPPLACADWFLPAARDRLDSLSTSPILSKLQNSCKPASTPGSRRSLFGDSSLSTRKQSPTRSSGAAEQGSEGPVEEESTNPQPVVEQVREQRQRELIRFWGA